MVLIITVFSYITVGGRLCGKFSVPLFSESFFLATNSLKNIYIINVSPYTCSSTRWADIYRWIKNKKKKKKEKKRKIFIDG
jgi:hypothetical protein